MELKKKKKDKENENKTKIRRKAQTRERLIERLRQRQRQRQNQKQRQKQNALRKMKKSIERTHLPSVIATSDAMTGGDKTRFKTTWASSFMLFFSLFSSAKMVGPV